MKNHYLGASVAGLIITTFLVPAISFAAEFRSGDQPSVQADETIKGNAYIAGGSVLSAGEVDGDLIAAGGTVIVSGPVQSDIAATGGTISLLGTVGGDVRIAGGNILLGGPIQGDAVVAGGQIDMTGSKIGGDVVIAGGTVRLESPVSGNVKIAGGDVYLNAPISGNVEMHAGTVTLGPKATIAGNFTYTAKSEATLESGAVVRGKTQYTASPSMSSDVRSGIAAFVSLWIFARFLMLLIGAFALAYFFRRYSSELVHTVARAPWIEMGRGFVFVIVTPIIGIVLLATVIGLPLGAIALLAYAATLIFASFACAIVIGSILYHWAFKGAAYEVTWKTILLGVVVYFVLGFIPFVGWLIKAGFYLATIGAAVSIKWGIAKNWR